MSTLAAVLVCPTVVVGALRSRRFFPGHNEIHDVISRYGDHQRIASVCPACTCLGISGTSTCGGKSRLLSKVNRIVACQGGVEDVQSVYHRPLGN